MKRLEYLKKQITDKLAQSIMAEYEFANEDIENDEKVDAMDFQRTVYQNQKVHFFHHPTAWSREFCESLNDYKKEVDEYNKFFVEAWNQFAHKIQEA